MKKLILTVASLLLALTALAQTPALDWACTYRYAPDNAKLTVRPKAVFMGDSITDQWWKDSAFFTDNNYLDRGISGQTTSHMLVRFRPDVLDLHPKYVAIMAGTNDIAGNNGPMDPDKIVGNLISMCELARANKIKVLLCSITPVTRYGWSKTMTGDPSEIIMGINAELEAYAAKTRGVTNVNYFDALKNPTNGIRPEYSPDGVHLTMDAYKIIEGIIKSYIK